MDRQSITLAETRTFFEEHRNRFDNVEGIDTVGLLRRRKQDTAGDSGIYLVIGYSDESVKEHFSNVKKIGNYPLHFEKSDRKAATGPAATPAVAIDDGRPTQRRNSKTGIAAACSVGMVLVLGALAVFIATS